MEDFSVYGIALVPVVVAMVELLKRAGVPKKFSPFIAVALGIFCGFYYLAPGEPQKAVFLGVVIGLSAIGLFSGTKNTMEELTNTPNPGRKTEYKNAAGKKVRALQKNKGYGRPFKK